MTLRKKTLLIVGLTLLGLIAAVYGATMLILERGFSELEVTQMRANSVRMQLTIERELQSLDALARDYAIWDEAAAFLESDRSEFADKYLTPDVLENLRANLMIYADTTGKIRFARSYDHTNHTETPLAAKVAAMVTRQDGLLFNPNSTAGKHGILRAGSSLLLFGAHPVRANTLATGNRGSFIVGRVLDDGELARLGDLIQMKLAVNSVVGELPDDFATAWEELKHGESGPYLAPIDEEVYAAYQVLLDQSRRPVALLRMTAKREVHAQAQSTLSYLLGALLIVGIVFIAITLINLERLVLARLDRITEDVNNISMGGDVSRRVAVQGTDELGTLAQHINHLLQNLGSQIDLEKAVASAQSAAQAKSIFLANMSHELRTPLNAIIGYSELVQDSVADHGLSGVIPDLQKIVEAAKHLQSIISAVLDISRIEAGKMELDNAPFDLRANMNSVRDIVAMRAAEKNLDLFVHVSQNVPLRIIGDDARLRQILVNLANNAIKFTERGSVEINAEAKASNEHDGWEIHFSVRDTGIGIPAQRFDRLFKAFSQVDPSSSRKYGGTGLGLAISRQLCEMMGGTMWAESVEGTGSTFHFTIRARIAPVEDREYGSAMLR